MRSSAGIYSKHNSDTHCNCICGDRLPVPKLHIHVSSIMSKFFHTNRDVSSLCTFRVYRPRTCCWTPTWTSRSLTSALATSSRLAVTWPRGAAVHLTQRPRSSRARTTPVPRSTSGWVTAAATAAASVGDSYMYMFTYMHIHAHVHACCNSNDFNCISRSIHKYCSADCTCVCLLSEVALVYLPIDIILPHSRHRHWASWRHQLFEFARVHTAVR